MDCLSMIPGKRFSDDFVEKIAGKAGQSPHKGK